MYSKEAIVAKVQDNQTLVLNKGKLDGMQVGQRFQVYVLGDEILDPVTQSNLGRLELIKGTGKIIHIQEKLSILKSDMQASPSKTIRRPKGFSKTDPFTSLAWRSIARASEEIEEILPPTTVDFDNPTVGDVAKPV